MVKHNNVVPNQHFHKDWQRYVKTWFNQPAKKEARRAARIGKAKKVAPRPTHRLRPIVRGQTNKYNTKLHAGRGFTFDELKAAGFNRYEARGLGIAVDHRRKNRSEEGFQLNVQRLKVYKSKLIVFPRNPSSKRAKKGDSSKEARAAAKQTSEHDVIPINTKTLQPKIKARKITKEESTAEVRKTLRKAHTDGKLWGARERRAKVKADAALAGKGKKGDDEGMGDE